MSTKCPFESYCAKNFHDGVCDTECNTLTCLYDGGDCTEREFDDEVIEDIIL